MSRTARRLLAVVLGAALFAGSFPAARAEEPEPLSPEARGRAQWAFAVGRLEEVDLALGASRAAVDRVPVEVLHRYWRPAGEAPGAEAPLDGTSLSALRLRWLADWPRVSGDFRQPDYPGEADPVPIVTALVLDRILRESRGVTGVADGGPLAAVPDEAVRAFLPFVRAAHHGQGADPAAGPPEGAPDPAADARERMRSLSRRNGIVAAVAGGAFVLLSAVLLWVLGRRGTA